MKKKIALLLAAVMTVGSLPMTAFASTENTVSSIKTVEDGDPIDVQVTLDEFKGEDPGTKQTVKLTLTNAKFRSDMHDGGTTGTTSAADAFKAAYDAASSGVKGAIDTQVNLLYGAAGNAGYIKDLADAKAALGTAGSEEEYIADKQAAVEKADTALEGYVGTDGKSGTVALELNKVDNAVAAMNKELAQNGNSGDFITALTGYITEIETIADTSASAVLGEIEFNGKTLSTIKGDKSQAGIIGNAIVSDSTNSSTFGTNNSNYATTVTSLTTQKGLASGADAFTFALAGTHTNIDGLGAEKAGQINDVLDKMNDRYAELVDLFQENAPVLTAANTYLGSVNTAYTNKKNADKDLIDAQTDYYDLKNAVTTAEGNIASAKTALVAAFGGDMNLINAYKALEEENGSVYDAIHSAVGGSGTYNGVTYTMISDTECMAVFNVPAVGGSVVLDLNAEADGSGDASVTIESIDSVVSSQTLKIANITDGATTTTISGTTSIKEKGSKIKNVVITETTAASIEAGTMKLRLTNGFKFTQTPAISDIVVFPNDGNLTVTKVERSNDDQDLLITFTGSSKTASTISVGNLYVGYDEDDVEVGDECEITVSDAGTTKQSIVVGKASDYTVSFTAEDKDLPTFYAGTYSEDTDSLVVTLKEELEDAWITGRSTKIVFPEGVEVVEVNVEDKGNTDAQDATNSSASNIKVDENEVDLGGVEVNNGKKAELELSFTLSISPEFTGDIEATLTGSGIGDDQTVVVGTAAAPVKVEADINELPIDYRKTEASDIVITEAAAGVLKKDTTVRLAIDGIAFDGDPTVEVESGDLKIENVKIKDEYLTFDVKTESQKEAAVIRISDVNLNMNRSLPAGDYDLLFTTSGDETNGEVTSESKLSKNAIIRNYNNDSKVEQGTFDVDEITALKGYVTVVTAGRDQDDSTFTTKVSVTIGASTMKAGTKDITLDVPAYISNGYTMMPVRAVTEALSGSAIVRWDDPTKTVTITFGQRVISMTVGSNVMKINGVDVAMQAQCEITDSRAFIPLRDLGYALGLNDSKIAWDDATKTATLN